MNVARLRQALAEVGEAIADAAVSDDKWEWFGRAAFAAIEDNYVVESVATSPKMNPNWRETARDLWNAARAVGLPTRRFGA